MTKEQAIEVLHELDGSLYETQQVALDIAIKALEQQSSEDCVSRQAVIAIASDSCLDLDNYEDTKEFCDEIKDLPPVTPQEPILNKIRANIENDWQLKKYPSSPFSCGLRRAIEIIDKYKAESEEV